MKIDVKSITQVDIKTVEICCKVRDNFCCVLKDQDGNKVIDYDGYVPGFMPGEHYGDYIELNIDLETGQILNWKNNIEIKIQEFINDINEGQD